MIFCYVVPYILDKLVLPGWWFLLLLTSGFIFISSCQLFFCLYFVMQVSEIKGDDVVCVIKNTATLAGSLFTLHISQIRIDLPTLTDADKDVSYALLICA